VEGNARVVDGDTIVIEDGKGGKERIRLLGIDAPESKQMCKDSKGSQYACGIESQQVIVASLKAPRDHGLVWIMETSFAQCH
jgi:endonuclease YncB( thermonuclease family)